MKKYFPYFEKAFNEFIRDFTSFGNVFLIVFLSLLIFGFKFPFFLIVLGLIVLEIITAGIKLIYPKERPKKENHSNILEKIDAGSFPSVHTARVTFFAFMTVSFTVNLNIQLGFANLLIILPFVVAFTRIKMKKHYLIDVIAGLIIGFVLYLIPVLVFIMKI